MKRQRIDIFRRSGTRRLVRVPCCFVALAAILAGLPAGYTDDQTVLDWAFKKPDLVLELGKELKEISGLDVDAGGNLIAHNDEQAKSILLSRVDGQVLETFEFKHGNRPILGDFEGIARVDDMTWLINSHGFLFRSKPGSDEVAVYNTGLEGICEVEGLAYWPARNAHVIACKTMRTKEFGKKAALFLWSLEHHSLDRVPVTISFKKLKKRFGIKSFHPSAVAISADGTQLLVLSSSTTALAILSADGDLLHAQKLKAKRHPQPEGLTLLPDGTLVIADEAQKGPATLTLYRSTETR